MDRIEQGNGYRLEGDRMVPIGADETMDSLCAALGKAGTVLEGRQSATAEIEADIEALSASDAMTPEALGLIPDTSPENS